MKRKQLRFGDGFRILFGNKRAQAAQMTLAPNKTEGGPDNRHRGADQWLFVVAGGGQEVTVRLNSVRVVSFAGRRSPCRCCPGFLLSLLVRKWRWPRR